MTKAELAAAFRERFARIRKDFPELIDMMSRVSDERVIEGHLRCGACKCFHLSVRGALRKAASSASFQEFLDWTQDNALRTWPKRCIAELGRIEAAITQSKPS